VFDPAALHDLLSFLDMLLLPFLDDLPQLIGKGIDSLVQLVLSRLVLSLVGELVAKVIELLDELL
jgi:hypothetical protein